MASNIGIFTNDDIDPDHSSMRCSHSIIMSQSVCFPVHHHVVSSHEACSPITPRSLYMTSLMISYYLICGLRARHRWLNLQAFFCLSHGRMKRGAGGRPAPNGEWGGSAPLLWTPPSRRLHFIYFDFKSRPPL